MSNKRIKRIACIRDYNVFRDYSWLSDLPEFGRYNLIYGWNGTGKTSLSRVFRYLEKRQNPNKGQITVKIEDTELTNGQFNNCDIPIRVFNRDFISEAVFTKNDEVSPIYIIGETNVEKQKKADNLKERLISATTLLSNSRKQLYDAERKYDQFCIDRAREIKNLLSSSPTNQYNNYNKANFQTNLDLISRKLLPYQFQLGEEDKERRKKQHLSTPKY